MFLEISQSASANLIKIWSKHVAVNIRKAMTKIQFLCLKWYNEGKVEENSRSFQIPIQLTLTYINYYLLQILIL